MLRQCWLVFKLSFSRMSPECFQHLLALVEPFIPCRSRKPIAPAERLMVSLGYLATGDSQQSQSIAFRIGRSTLSSILRETCQAIWLALQDYIKSPSTTTDRKRIADGFMRSWNFPNCIGACHDGLP